MTDKELELLGKIVQLETERNNLKHLLEKSRETRSNKVSGGTGLENEFFKTNNADKTYREFVEQLPQSVLALYPDATIFYANKCFQEFSGFTLKELSTKNLFDFITDQEKSKIKKLFKRAQKKKALEKISFEDKDRNLIPFLISITPLQLDNHLSLSIVLTDVSQLQEAHAKLDESLTKNKASAENVKALVKQLKDKVKELKVVNTRLEAFAYITSHHLQEPLRKIRTFGSLLKDRYYTTLEEAGQNYIDRMEISASRMQQMIDDLLTYSKVAKDVTFKPCNLNGVLQLVLSDLEILIKETRGKIHFPPMLATIDANSSQIQLLFTNIIENALKFHKKDTPPEIQLSCEIIHGSDSNTIPEERKNERFCRLIIKDNGIGFSNEFSSQIFLLFKKLNQEIEYPGTGIGLAICETIVANHRGIIMADSKEDKGTSIVLLLPIKQNISDSDTKQSLNLMIADDDQDDRNLMQLAFEEINSPLALEFAHDGHELLSKLNKRITKGEALPDLILLDLNMPKMDGRVALREIKADEKLHNLNVIVFSTSQSPEDRKMALDLGANEFISKPADFNDMIELFSKIYQKNIK